MNQLKLLGRVVVVGVVLAMVAGCSPSPGTSSQPTGTMPPTSPAAASPTPAPSATPAPTATSTPSAAPSEAPPMGWPYTSTWEIRDVLFAEDGRVVLVESHWEAGEGRITVLDGDGSPVPGWPWTPATTGSAALRVAFGPDDSLYVTAGGESWSLHRLSPDGKEMEGFPLDLPAVPWCGLDVNDADAFVTCQDENEETGTGTTEVRVVEQDGSTRYGWPVGLAGLFTPAGFGPDGRIYLSAWTRITALASDGTEVAGWPRKISGIGEAGVQIDAQGRVRVTSRSDITEQCGLPDKTVYRMLRPDGSTAPGWPVKVRGWSSMPELADDGTMVVASGAGKVTAYSSRGVVRDGWPVRRVGVTVGCWGGSRPWATGDGTMVVVGDGRATLLEAGGQVASGWPVTLPYKVANSCDPCAPGPGGPLDPAVGERAMYIGAYQGDEAHGTDGLSTRQPRVMVVERDGSMPSEAQRLIGKAGDTLSWVRIAPTGRVWALTMWYPDDGEAGALHLIAEDAAPGS